MGWVIVTGGTRGIGRGISLHLLKKGYEVLAFYRENAEAAESFSQSVVNPEFYNARSKLIVQQCNVACERNVNDFFATHLQDKNVIALVNNAGVYTRDKSSHAMEKMFRTNFFGACYMTRAFAEFRRTRKQNGMGAVVNIGSTAGLHGPTGSAAYAASKAALHRMMAELAREYAEEGIIHINTIVCGPVDTGALHDSGKWHRENTPTKMLTTPGEVARAVEWLIEERNSNIVGAEIQIDGGKIL